MTDREYRTIQYWFDDDYQGRQKAYVRSSEHPAIICEGVHLRGALVNLVSVLQGMIMEPTVCNCDCRNMEHQVCDECQGITTFPIMAGDKPND